MTFNSLRVAYEIAIAALAEELYDDWPTASPEEIMQGFKARMHDRLYGDQDLLKEEDEQW